ncbi:phosphoenolpyruvate hydrolase family protein [Halomonas sp. ANAO-440]|uniref:phosphoenolpyruvate hydrolase family protein n=1 Tax=Halomonas sp. ANAO-440 TaxID=2861360 RepID=UPI001CAA7B11|nr:phosphoenolpyruvate hydrolase family protein [Halomonas sp. ANAO-440]MBZ0331504.1 phosphoenolpyruvate hydrolase family protein [Halomonas sp. ANAO-440]
MTEAFNGTIGHLVASLEEARQQRGGPSLLSPMTARLPATLADLGSSLPIGDANGELLDALRNSPAFPETTYAGVLANDPFRLADDLLEMLARLGCKRVANWPSTALLSGELAETLTHSGLGYREEMAFLTQARKRGFATLAIVSQPSQLPLAMATKPTQLMIAAGLSASVDTSPSVERRELQVLAQKIKAEGKAVWCYEHDGVAELMAALHPVAEVVIRHPQAVER